MQIVKRMGVLGVFRSIQIDTVSNSRYIGMVRNLPHRRSQITIYNATSDFVNHSADRIASFNHVEM